MMHMTFYWGTQVTILIDSWKTYSWTSYLLSLLALFLLSIFYQYMEDRRIKFKSLPSSPTNPLPPRSAATVPLLYPKLGGGGGRWSGGKVGGAVLFGVNSAMGYLLMLAIMSFNGGVFVVVVVGLAVGYLIFRSGEEEGVVLVDNPCACA